MLKPSDEEDGTPSATSLHDKDEAKNPGPKPENFPDWEKELENPRNWPAWRKSLLMAAMSASAITGYNISTTPRTIIDY